jgi:hypothetical protein
MLERREMGQSKSDLILAQAYLTIYTGFRQGSVLLACKLRSVVSTKQTTIVKKLILLRSVPYKIDASIKA